jgi:hypothetical protein
MTRPGTRKLMRHEHLVRINDPGIPRTAWLTRSQLWQGLLHTVTAPQCIDASIDSATINHRCDILMGRTIVRGTLTVCDEVELVAEQRIIVRADSTGAFAGSTLLIRIEEPAPQALFVRFIYELHSNEDASTEEEDTARRSAYQSSDLERIRQARQFVSTVH